MVRQAFPWSVALDVSGLAAAKKPRDAVALANVSRFSHVLVRAVQFIGTTAQVTSSTEAAKRETMSNESVVLEPSKTAKYIYQVMM